ncbi:multi protein bridging factor 1-domain-containing protein [Cladochytrium replicatum]|nr:multi protein bridging factor 1-domain-containing protein [Cladochytrium replicatum]
MSDDWDSVTVIRKKPTGPKTIKTDAALNQARKSGVDLSTERKATPSNKAVAIEASKAAKVDRETEDFSIDKVDKSVAAAIRDARNAAGLTQAQLAQKINEQQKVINEYESGRALNPNQQTLMKMERALNVKLRGTGIGQPLRKK